MGKVWMVLVVAVGLLLVSAGVAVAAPSDNAEKVGQGSSSMLDGLAGLYSDVTNNPDFGKWVGWAIVIAVGLWVLRLMGLRRG